MMEDMKAVAQILGEYLPAAHPMFMPPRLALHITPYHGMFLISGSVHAPVTNET